jgi:dTDP-4-dehydrorhamnose reductase
MKLKKILVIGKNGQLGSEILCQSENFEFLDLWCYSSDELNLTNFKQVEDFILSNNFDVVINCGAFTDVEKAESCKDSARAINALAVKNLAACCAVKDCFLIHISTDYVFDGSLNYPIDESITPNPLGTYGKTKLEGEQYIVDSQCKHLIFRISWLYSQFGNNFVKTISRLSSYKKELKVVYDQVGTPTSAIDFSSFLLKIIEQGSYLNFRGVYHFSNEGVCSWYDFAIQIVQSLAHDCTINPVLSDEYPSLAPRPNYLVLNKAKVRSDFNIEIEHWNDSLRKFLSTSEDLKLLTTNTISF